MVKRQVGCHLLATVQMKVSALGNNSCRLLRLILAYYASTKMKVRASGRDPLSFDISPGVLQGCALSPTLLNYNINLKGYTRVQFGTNIHVFDLAYADYIVLSSSSYGMRINASKTKVMSTIIPGG